MSRQAEVRWGTAQEQRVADRWMKCSPNAAEATHVVKGGEYDDFDFVVFAKRGLVLCYLEVKVRRSPLARFGDAICPARKHAFAILSRQRQGIPFYLVTEYGCGALVEVDLGQKPASRRDIKRRDRSGPAVPHVIYSKAQLSVIDS